MRYVKALVFVLMILLVACGEDYDIDSNISEDMQEFESTDQDGDTFTSEDMEGEWWVADMVFTNCTTVCLTMTPNMSSLQDKVAEEDDVDAEFASFSVDPDYDTPEVLKEYAEEYDADESNWHFLTGYDFDTIKEISVKSFKQLLEEPPEGDDQVMHGTKFFLIDPDGEVVKFYDGMKANSIDEILEDLKTVQ